MNNRKGFTMVELLAVITILGILAGIGVVSIQRANVKARENFYNTQRSTLTNAATSYLADHKNGYPDYVGQTSNITLKQLRDDKYIGEFTDHSKAPNSCKDNTKVVVLRTDTNKFKYYTVLNCDSIKDKELEPVSSTGSEIKKSPDGKTLTIKINQPDGYKIKKYSYVIRQASDKPDIRSNTVTPSTISNSTIAEIDISDISSAATYVHVYFVTTNDRFGDFHN